MKCNKLFYLTRVRRRPDVLLMMWFVIVLAELNLFSYTLTRECLSKKPTGNIRNEPPKDTRTIT